MEENLLLPDNYSFSSKQNALCNSTLLSFLKITQMINTIALHLMKTIRT